MKKFLTVLLVIAVMFTFSFGSAFAATSEEYNAYYSKVDTAEKQAAKTLDTDYTDKVNALVEGTVTVVGYVASVEAQKAGLDAWYEDAVEEMEDKIKLLMADYDNNYTKTASALAAEIYGAVTDYDATKYEAEMAREEVAQRIEDLTAQVVAIENDYDARTTTIVLADKTKVETSYAQLAADEIARLQEEIAAEAVAEDATLAECKTAIGNLNGIKKAWTADKDDDGNTIYVFPADKIYVGGDSAKGVTLLTAEQVDASDLTTEATKASALAVLSAKSAELYSHNIAAKLDKTYNAAAYAEAEEVRAAFVAINTWRIENAETATELATLQNNISNVAAVTGWYTARTSYVKNMEAIEELEAFAAKYAAEKDVEGVLVRDAELVDEVVADAIEAAYSTPTVVWTGLADAKEAIMYNCYTANNELDFAKACRTAQLEEAREAALKKYYEPEQADVNAKFDEAIAKVEAAETVEKVDAVADPDLSKIKDKEAVKKAIRTAVANEIDVNGPVGAYVEYLNKIATKDANKITMPTAAEWEDFYAEAGARTAKEVAALVDAAKAEVDAIPTAGELDAEKDAVEEMIKALPSKITEADKAAVEAAWEANKAYKGTVRPYNEGVLKAAVKTIASAEKKAIEKKVAALKAASLITLADKAEILALQNEIDAFNELVAADSDAMYEGVVAPIADLTAHTTKVKELDDAHVEALINALPLNITADDKEAVEAARAAYDAYVAEYTDYIKEDNAAGHIANRGELFDAEEALKEIYIESVEALKITAKSSAKKGSITVKWTVKGETYAVDGYEIWKSTKKNSGFKKAFTTEKMSYKNTKGLKKGTRYYYKVRAIAYNAAGEKFTSDWSNKAYRIAK